MDGTNGKPDKRRDVSRTILKSLVYAGAIAIAATSPRFGERLIPELFKYVAWKKRQAEKDKKRFFNSFRYLRRKGLIRTEYQGRQLHISLTDEGRQYVKKYQIDDLAIRKPFRWDKKWRVLIFDIEEKQRIKREALRGKLKELGLFKLQHSVWVCPYSFQKEMTILRDFFGLKNREMRIITASEIESDDEVRKFFNLN